MSIHPQAIVPVPEEIARVRLCLTLLLNKGGFANVILFTSLLAILTDLSRATIGTLHEISPCFTGQRSSECLSPNRFV